MSAKWFKLSAAAILAIGLAAAPASAKTEELTLTNANGTVDSGWSATWDSSLDSQLTLVSKGVVGNNFFIEKDATFNANDLGGLAIVFQKTSPDAKTLVINDETIINNSGIAWNGFNFALGTGSDPNSGMPGFAFATSDGSSGLGDFSIKPFTSFNFSSQDTVLTVADGTVNQGDVWLPGSTSQMGLAIVANGDSVSSFALKEIPNAIPLPAAAWTGLSTLLGLGLIGIAKNARKLLA